MNPALTATATPSGPSPAASLRAGMGHRVGIGEGVIRVFLFLAGALSVATTIGIVVVLGSESLLFFRDPQVSLVEFLTGTRWQPAIGDFGIWPLATSTLITSTIALIVSVPLGLSAAIYLSEYASPRARASLKPILEILAGIPTVVYGYFALTFMTPILRGIFGSANVHIYNMASGGIVMGIMILPLISSMSEDALNAVTRSLREAAYAVGATRLETGLQVVVPAAVSGIVAAFIIGMSRALGETMIVALSVGAGPNLTFNPFESAETITGHIPRISGG